MRRKLLRLHPEKLLQVMKAMGTEGAAGTCTYTVNGLPADAQVAACACDAYSGEILLQIVSESFEDVPFGNISQELRVSFTEHR